MESDEELLRRSREGDEEAFALLYSRRQGSVYRFALRMSGSEALADDVTQEAFLALLNRPSGYEEERGSVLGYLFGVARNHLLRSSRQTRASVPIDESEDEGGSRALAVPEEILARLTAQEDVETLWQGLLSLPPHYREAIVLCDLEEMDYASAAGLLGCPVGTVRSRLNRGRRMLIDRLRRSGDAERCLA
ncbi:MAG: RNA polymerase sigma factor [Bryobacteraceae bacterium]